MINSHFTPSPFDPPGYPHTNCKQLKVSWIRNNDAPIGFPAPGHLSCPCGHAPESRFDPSQPDIFCQCGRRYSWEGCIKGVSIGSDTLTAYRVIFEDGTEYSTSMGADTNLQAAFNYFHGQRINLTSREDNPGKLCVDVEPCRGGKL